MSYPNALVVAKLHWVRGQPIPTDLHATLASKGYDVDALETKFLTSRNSK